MSTKIAAGIKDYDATVTSIDASLAALDLEYIDLILIHAPQPWDDFRGGDFREGKLAGWRALEKCISGRQNPRDRGSSSIKHDTIQNRPRCMPQVSPRESQ